MAVLVLLEDGITLSNIKLILETSVRLSKWPAKKVKLYCIEQFIIEVKPGYLSGLDRDGKHIEIYWLKWP